jgi:putative intracellular protease/amidase
MVIDKAASRRTTSAPSHQSPNTGSDLVAERAAATEELAASITHNPNKPGEFGRKNAVSPIKGFSARASSPLAGASTVTERNVSDKTGAPAPEGASPITASLENERVDSTGSVMTTNQGVEVSDNQNSLKAGLRGPSLLDYVASRLGTYATASGGTIDADASMENTAEVLFDALVLPDGQAGVRRLAADARTVEFLVNQYRHGKPILALGASSDSLDAVGISTVLPFGGDDAGLLIADSDVDASDAFIQAIEKYRYPERETDPPVGMYSLAAAQFA